MNKECNENLLKTLELASQLKKTADKGLCLSNDDNCILIYGLIKDYCYKIKQEVENEIKKHKQLNKWF